MNIHGVLAELFTMKSLSSLDLADPFGQIFVRDQLCERKWKVF